MELLDAPHSHIGLARGKHFKVEQDVQLPGWLDSAGQLLVTCHEVIPNATGPRWRRRQIKGGVMKRRDADHESILQWKN